MCSLLQFPHCSLKHFWTLLSLAAVGRTPLVEIGCPPEMVTDAENGLPITINEIAQQIATGLYVDPAREVGVAQPGGCL
jgi:hypothetical protein